MQILLFKAFDTVSVDHGNKAIGSNINREDMHTCKLCYKIFETKKASRAHTQFKHRYASKNGDLKCKYCPKLFNQNHMPQHMNLKHPGDKTLLSESKTKPVTLDFTEAIVVKEDAKARCNSCATAYCGGNHIKMHVVSLKRLIAKAAGIFGLALFFLFLVLLVFILVFLLLLTHGHPKLLL